jgi:hypothetical protein
VTEEVAYDRRREAVDALTGLTLRDEKGNPIFEHFEETVTETRAPIYLYADTFDMTMTTETQTRYRGIFEVPVYTGDIGMTFDFDLASADEMLSGKEVAHWDDASLRVYLSSNKALRGEALLEADGRMLRLEPISSQREEQTGITARVGDPRDIAGYKLHLGINGAQTLAATATGRTTRVTLKSDWPDPSFYGAFLPDTSSVSDAGFEATWVVPHLARSLPQISRSFPDGAARQTASMGVRFITPNDFYQKAWRSARYGILFIALTFLTILCRTDRLRRGLSSGLGRDDRSSDRLWRHGAETRAQDRTSGGRSGDGLWRSLPDPEECRLRASGGLDPGFRGACADHVADAERRLAGARTPGRRLVALPQTRKTPCGRAQRLTPTAPARPSLRAGASFQRDFR